MGGSAGNGGSGAGQGGAGVGGAGGGGVGGGGAGVGGGGAAGDGGAGQGGVGGAVPICGNGVVEGDEACDGSTTVTCAGAIPGSPGGVVVCGADCKLDTSGCKLAPSCGDGVKEADEECDGGELGGATCATATGVDAAQGMLGCTPGCKLDTTACFWCGDGVKNGAEECDPTGFEAPACPIMGGSISCTGGCKLDKSKCQEPTCTDTVKNGSETDVDCGGTCALTCANDKGCGAPGDCHSASCTAALCKDAASCMSLGDCGGNGLCLGGRCFENGATLRAVPDVSAPCPPGWTSIGPHGCFLRPPGTKTWYEAFKDCRARGANLAMLKSGGELNAVGKNAAGGNISNASQRVWAGLACKDGSCDSEGSWYWLDDTVVADSWGQQGPSVGTRCGALRLRNDDNIGVNARACGDALPYVCEL